jgi:ComF family protein
LSNPLFSLLDSCINYVQSRVAQPCFLCGARSRGQILCPDCAADLPRLAVARCPVCATPTLAGAVCGRCLKQPPAFGRTVAVYRYDFPVSVLVQQLKYGGELALAPWLADRLAEQVGTTGLPDLLIPMPLHGRRLRERGFNQAALIAGGLAKRLDLPSGLDVCRRVKDTRPQVELPIKSRRGNMRNAFACDADLSGKRVALVDDVMTSGASLDELARVVKKAGAIEVEAWVLTRTVRS